MMIVKLKSEFKPNLKRSSQTEKLPYHRNEPNQMQSDALNLYMIHHCKIASSIPCQFVADSEHVSLYFQFMF